MRSRFPGVVPCRAGCAACCHGPFDISVADTLVVRQAVAALDGGTRAGLQRRAREQMARMLVREPGFDTPYDVAQIGEDRFDALVETAADEPCPALDREGRCLIYPGRPMVCRMMGLGMRTQGGAELANACPIQGEHPAYRELPAQPFDLEGWEADEEAALRRAALALFQDAGRRGYETTVAGAILLGAR